MQMDEIEKILKETGLCETELIFKHNIKQLRRMKKKTIMQAATEMGLKYGKYRLMESLTPLNVKFETFELIAKYYNVSVSDLFKL